MSLFKWRPAALILLCGATTFTAGLFLMRFGLTLLLSILQGNHEITSYPLLNFAHKITPTMEIAALILVILGLGVGILKGRTVITKSCKRNIARILSLPSPALFTRFYPLAFYPLILLMASMGYILRNSGAPSDIIGVVYLAIGSALIQGSVVLIKSGLFEWKKA
jgi:hypothetical protein